MENINTHIEKDKKILDDPQISAQQRRHIEDELDMLRRYKDNHPNDDHDPTALELFCDSNPEEPECKIFDL